MLVHILCRLGSHRPDRKRVWNDGLNYRTGCRRCEAPLIRTEERWRRFDPVADRDPARQTHPVARPAILPQPDENQRSALS